MRLRIVELRMRQSPSSAAPVIVRPLMPVKALRTEPLLTMVGRGNSAAEMTPADGATILLAVASNAVTSRVGEVMGTLRRLRW
jgi:hypothetical protein